jgi:serine/threonine protein kinase
MVMTLMVSKLRPAQERFFTFLTTKAAGDVVTEEEILSKTGWKPITLGTYKRKHHLDPFLSLIEDGRYRVLRDGSSISKAELSSAFTQVRPGLLVLTKGAQLRGSSQPYELLRPVGQGAVAHVWEAIGKNDSKRYAAKVMNPRPDLLEPSILENVRRRFAREVKNGMRLEHSGVIPYRDLGEISGHPFLIMDLAEESLLQILQRGKLSLRASLPIIQSCLVGLDYLHNKGCVHRDIKPANILKLARHYVLGDLGIVLWSDMSSGFTTAGTITRASIQLGSWYYMAPEQRRTPHTALPSSDIYSLGVTWYEMLSGDTPGPDEIAAKRFASPTSTPDANEIIGKMLEFDPIARPSIREVLAKISVLEKNQTEQ